MWTARRFVYTAFVMDVFSRRIVGWRTTDHLRTDPVLDALDQALYDRLTGIEGDRHLIAHSDAGTHDTSIRFAERLDLEGIRPSTGSAGDAYDNALMEPVIGLFKTERIRTTVFHTGPYRKHADLEHATAGWVDWYNQPRLHGPLEMLSPVEYESAHYATLTPEPQPK